MLVSLKEILQIAEERGCAVGSFNTPNLSSLRAVIGAAEALNEPVIIMHAQVHEQMGICSMEEIAPVMLMFAKRAKVPVCVHLDHGTDLDYIGRGLELGFTGVMYDGSGLSVEENAAVTRRVVELAKNTGASVEAEVGSIGGDYTDPPVAAAFAESTGIDALACAIGTVHGFYSKAPKLDFDRLKKIRELVSLPLVMHGGSGLSTEDFRTAIAGGIRKINYYTYMAKAGASAVSGRDYALFHELLLDAEKAMRADVEAAIGVFSGR